MWSSVLFQALMSKSWNAVFLAFGNSRAQTRSVEPRLATENGVAVAQVDGALVARVTARALLEQDGP
ncbi:MAG: hypothetical protein DME24_10155 [Verrucomicrobia bacterium]|nr:MAG: hypothetical protein DME24_10155 [Verrucomicrobiota bacterium]